MPLHTEHIDSDFDYFVPSRALCIEDESTSVAQLAFWDHHQ